MKSGLRNRRKRRKVRCYRYPIYAKTTYVTPRISDAIDFSSLGGLMEKEGMTQAEQAVSLGTDSIAPLGSYTTTVSDATGHF